MYHQIKRKHRKVQNNIIFEKIRFTLQNKYVINAIHALNKEKKALLQQNNHSHCTLTNEKRTPEKLNKLLFNYYVYQ